MHYVTNGCFDLLHQGHMHFFREMKKHMDGYDQLTVYVNTDMSVMKLKGTSRPILTQKTRADGLCGYLRDLFRGEAAEVVLTDNPLISIEKEYGSYSPGSVVYVKDTDTGLNGSEGQWMHAHGHAILSIPRLVGISTSSIIAACNEPKQSS